MDTDDLCRMYESGMSCYAIGQKVGLHRTTVRDKLRRSGFQLRNHQEAIDLRYNQGQVRVQEVSPVDTNGYEWVQMGHRWVFKKTQGRRFIVAGAINKLAGSGWYGWTVFDITPQKGLTMPTMVRFGATQTLDEAKSQVEFNLQGA